jgi:hypothetical protein
MYIVKVCRAWRDPTFNELNKEWHYEHAYDEQDIKMLKEKWYDVEVVGRIVDKKVFSRGSLTQTVYYIFKCDDGNTYIEKFRIDYGGSWSIIVKGNVDFEAINGFATAEKAWKEAFLKEYPANCPFLIP